MEARRCAKLFLDYYSRSSSHVSRVLQIQMTVRYESTLLVGLQGACRRALYLVCDKEKLFHHVKRRLRDFRVVFFNYILGLRRTAYALLAFRFLGAQHSPPCFGLPSRQRRQSSQVKVDVAIYDDPCSFHFQYRARNLRRPYRVLPGTSDEKKYSGPYCPPFRLG